MKHKKWTCLACGLLCACALSQPAQAAWQPATPAAAQSALLPSAAPSSAMLPLVNAQRAAHGLPALQTDAALTRAAQVRARELRSRFSHTRPNGTRGLTAIREAGLSYRTAGENIAYGQPTAQAVMHSWMQSAGHRANILHPRFDRLGAATFTVGGQTYWVQLFAG